MRHAHGNFDSSAGPYRGKSEQAESSPHLGKHLHLILGPPGTGKTTRLLGLLGDVLQRGTGPEQVAFVSFTRAARAEARSRVLEQLCVGEDDLPWFRTIHSAAYRLLGLGKTQVMGPAHWRSFCDRYRYKLTNPTASLDDDPFAMPARTEDDKLRYVLEWARNRRIALAKANGRCGVHVHTQRVQGFADRLAKFKAEHGLLDFGDMLERVLERRLRPEVTVAFIDEAQDLSPFQIAVVEFWFPDCERVFVRIAANSTRLNDVSCARTSRGRRSSHRSIAHHTDAHPPDDAAPAMWVV